MCFKEFLIPLKNTGIKLQNSLLRKHEALTNEMSEIKHMLRVEFLPVHSLHKYPTGHV